MVFPVDFFLAGTCVARLTGFLLTVVFFFFAGLLSRDARNIWSVSVFGFLVVAFFLRMAVVFRSTVTVVAAGFWTDAMPL